MTFVGDVMFGRWIEGGLDPIDFKGVDVFGRMHDLLAADLTVANLETPLLREMPETSPYGTRLRFAAPPEVVDVLLRAGITVVSLANHHSFDMRMTGLLQTPKILAERGVKAIGVSRREEPLFRVESVDVEGWKLGFLAATTERNGPQRKNAPELPHTALNQLTDRLVPVIRAARPDHDLIIAVLHWGVENQDRPSSRQIKAAHALIDAGADNIIGHHRHVLQAIELYGKGLIAYSLGNFLFDNTTPNQQLTGVLRLRYRADGRCLDRAVLHPAYVHGYPTHHPRPATSWMRRKVSQRIIPLSQEKPFHTRWQAEGRDLVLAAPACKARSSPVGGES